MIEIIPAILTNSPDEFEKMIRLVEPHTARAHLDIADGIFVPNETIRGYPELELVSTGLKFDVHLMVKSPLDQMQCWGRESADRFIIHVESEGVGQTITELRSMNKSIGLAVNPDTPNKAVEPFAALVDFIQFMTINPGFYGREFMGQVLEKIDIFHKKYPEVVLAVDGGINPTTAKSVIEAGVNILVSGSFVLKSGNVGKAIEELRKISENN